MTGDSSSLSKLFTGSLLVFVGLLVQKGIKFLSRIIVARLLGTAGYGSVMLGLTLLLSLSTICVLGMQDGIARYLPRYNTVEERRGIFFSAIQSVLPITIFLTALVIIFSETIASRAFNNPQLDTVLVAFGAALPSMVFLKITIGLIRGDERFIPRILLQNIVLPLIQICLIVAAIAFGFQTSGVAWGYMVSYAIVSLLCLYYVYEHTEYVDSREHIDRKPELLAFSLPLVAMSVMELVFVNLDTFMIGIYTNVEFVGIYNSVYPLSVLITTVLLAFRFLAMPILSSLHADGDNQEMKRLFQNVSRWIFVASVPLLLAFGLFPQKSILLTFGPEYVGGSTALRILSAGFFTHAVAGLNGATLTSIGDTKLIMYDNMAVALVNLILNLILIPSSPLVGAAVATAVSYSLMNALYTYQLYTRTGIHPFTELFLRTASISIVLAGLGYVIGTFAPTSTNLMYCLFLLVFGLAYACGIVRYIEFTEYDRKLASQIEAKIGSSSSYPRKIVQIIQKPIF